MKIRTRLLVNILVLAGLYIIAAKLGLSLAFSVKQITTVWPPSGLALAALILLGYDVWPGIFLGAFIANLLTNEPAGVALGIAVGNTLEAVVGAALLKQLVRFRPELDKVRDVVGLALFSALISTMVGASVGTTSLALGGLLPWSAQASAWLLWWFGDMGGVLLFAPFFLVWLGGWRRLHQYSEFLVLLISTGLAAAIIFFGQLKPLGSHPQVPYLIFPFIIWAAFRFKQLGVTAVSVIASIIAVLGTAAGHGPFAGAGTTQQQLITLFLYIILISASGLFMAVAVLQREFYEQRLIREAEELRAARDKILSELDAKAERTVHLEDANKRITGILNRLLDEAPGQSKRDL